MKKRLDKAVKELQRIPDIKETAPENVLTNKYKKVEIDENLTVYINDRTCLVTSKSDPSGMGGQKIKILLEDNNHEILVGPYFYSRAEANILIQSKKA